MKYLIALNGFKECAGPIEMSRCLSGEMKKIKAVVDIREIPLSDGGDGFFEVCRKNYNLASLSFRCRSSYDESEITVRGGYDSLTRRLYMESTDIFGLRRVPAEFRSPMKNNSRGLGQISNILIRVIASGLDISELMLGIGGSAINDFGAGAFREFGGSLLDGNGREINSLPEGLANLHSIIPPEHRIELPVKVVYDVDAGLTGAEGTSLMFARQKGASESEVKLLEEAGQRIERILSAEYPGVMKSVSGASGGITALLSLCCDIELIPARNFILDELVAEQAIEKADIVITGEGHFDRQSFLNKATGVIVNAGLKKGKSVVVVCGSADETIRGEYAGKVRIIELVKYFPDASASIKNWRDGFTFAASEISG